MPLDLFVSQPVRAVDLHHAMGRHLRQTGDADTSSRRPPPAREVAPVNVFHGRVVLFEVREVSAYRYRVLKAQTATDQHGLQVLQNLMCLRLDTLGSDLPFERLDRWSRLDRV